MNAFDNILRQILAAMGLLIEYGMMSLKAAASLDVRFHCEEPEASALAFAFFNHPPQVWAAP